MYTFLHGQADKSALFWQVVPMAGAMVTAELLYKFHSFTLECLAFLATWYAFDALAAGAKRVLARAA